MENSDNYIQVYISSNVCENGYGKSFLVFLENNEVKYFASIYMRSYRFFKRVNNPEIFYKALLDDSTKINIYEISYLFKTHSENCPIFIREFVKISEKSLIKKFGSNHYIKELRILQAPPENSAFEVIDR